MVGESAPMSNTSGTANDEFNPSEDQRPRCIMCNEPMLRENRTAQSTYPFWFCMCGAQV